MNYSNGFIQNNGKTLVWGFAKFLMVSLKDLTFENESFKEFRLSL